jgi:hypothetical protein
MIIRMHLRNRLAWEHEERIRSRANVMRITLRPAAERRLEKVLTY